MPLEVLLGLALVIAPSGGPKPAWCRVVPAMVKVRPGMEISPGPAFVDLEEARGECQSAQVVIQRGAWGAPQDVVVQAAPLQGPASSSLPVDLAREGWVNLQVPSNATGAPGWWPDALIPDIDPIEHERRRAFPVSVTADHPEVVVVQACSAQDQRPGSYRGEVVVSARELNTVRLVLRVRVSEVTLPATSSLPTSFGFSAITATRAHGGDPANPAAVMQLAQRYARLALLHRVSLHGMTMEPPSPRVVGGHLQLDFSQYDAEVAPFLDGTALPSGAQFTSTDARQPPANLPAAFRAEYWRLTRDHLAARGWLERAFVYAPDEPTPPVFPQVRALADLVHANAPGLRVLVTATHQPGLLGTADIWTPNVNCLFAHGPIGYCPVTLPVDGYAAARSRGQRLWWYQSCGSHGCGGPGGPSRDFEGWASYMIDLPAGLNRAMGIAAYESGIEGELYYDTVEDYDGPDPWTQVFRYGGNGEGSLFYPGTPQRIGGRSDVPLSSLRLERIRDGLQDYEYLHLAERLGVKPQAMALAWTVVRRPWDIEQSAGAWESWHHQMLALLEAHWSALADVR